MHMLAYLAGKPRGTAAAVARKAGVSHATITKLAADQCWPSREIWVRVVEATDGQVSPDDHLSTGRKDDDHHG